MAELKKQWLLDEEYEPLMINALDKLEREMKLASEHPIERKRRANDENKLNLVIPLKKKKVEDSVMKVQ